MSEPQARRRRVIPPKQAEAPEPQRLTRAQILGRIHFHEHGAKFYEGVDQDSMAAWSLSMVEEYRAKLRALNDEVLAGVSGEGAIQ